MKDKLPIYEFLIDDTEESGVKAISLVSSPAMQSEFIAFNSVKPKSKYIFIKKDEKEYKGIVAGLSMIPDKLIYRVDETTGEQYNGYFSADTIEKIRDKYHKEMQTSNVNLEHVSTNTVDAYLVESYLLDSEDRVKETLAKGIEDATLGSWYTAFKIEDKEVFDSVLEGTFTGFSVECFLNREIRSAFSSTNNNNKLNTKKMKKNLVERLKERVNKILSEVKFDEAMSPELGFLVSWDEVGEAVTKTYTNPDGVEITEPIGKGEFVVDGGMTIVVDEASNLVEIREAVAEPAPAEPVVEPAPVDPIPAVSGDTAVSGSTVSDFEKPLGSYFDLTKDGKYTIEVLIEAGAIKNASVKSIATLMSELEFAMSDLDKKLRQLIPNDKAGTYSISVDVNDKGEYSYGVVSSYTHLQLSSEETIANLKAEIEALNVKLSAPIAEPILQEATATVVDAKVLTVYERTAIRKGLPIM